MKVLVVDDEIQIRQMLQSFLTRTGWHVELADNVDHAMEKLDESFDVVLSDIRMNGASGIDLLREVKSGFPSLEVIMMTGYSDIQDSIEALSLRAFAYLRKPFDLAEVNQKLVEAARTKDINQREEYYKIALEEQLSRRTRQFRIEKEKLQAIFSTVPNFLLVVDDNMRLIDCNQTLENFTGQPIVKLHGKDICEILRCDTENCSAKTSKDKANCPLVHLVSKLKEGDGDIVRMQIAMNIIHKDDPVRTFFRASCSMLPSKDIEDKFYLIMLEDISAEKKMELQLIHSGRMTALGEMATGVAHELNQPLNGIAAYIQLMESRIMAGRNIDPEEQLSNFRDILHEVNRMSQIIEHMKIFSRSGKIPNHKEPVDIQTVYNSSMKLLRTQFVNHGIELQEDLPDNLPAVLGDNVRIQQVFMNILINARDALDSMAAILNVDELLKRGKKISISMEESYRNDKKGVSIFIEDNGLGISDENASKIFDPFFTTKSPDKGTGLGMSISYGIVKDLDGEIEIETEKNVKTQFTVWLPAYYRQSRD